MAGELYGDYSRMPIGLGTHVRSLFAQQGRVVLDSDVNEQTSILLQQLRTIAGDLIGPHGGPEGSVGFGIAPSEVADEPDLVIQRGRYYVDGILCEVDEPTSFFDQSDAFFDHNLPADALPATPFLVYLKVWERTISAIEDPATREVALGNNGPDTTTRNRVVWQVLVSSDGFDKNLDLESASEAEVLKAWSTWFDKRNDDRATLKARADRPAGADDDPCPTPPSSSYRGVENQLYRVEIHCVDLDGDIGTTATFKWSRDNGSATYPIEALTGEVATLTTLGRDRGLMLDVGDWVEVIDDRYILYPGGGPFGRTTSPLLRVMDVEPLDRTVKLSAAPEGSVGQFAALHPFLRRWDQQPRPGGGPKIVNPSNGLEVRFGTSGPGGKDVWIDLEDGVQVAFQPGRLRVGDYWLFTARTEIGDVEWPFDAAGNRKALPPLGIDYAFAPLAVVRKVGPVLDLRRQFQQLAV